MNRFWITIQFDWRNRRYLVEHIKISKREEHFKVLARNGSITFSSNRPFFRSRGLRHRHPSITVIEGHLWNISITKKLLEQIQAYVESTIEPQEFFDSLC